MLTHGHSQTARDFLEASDREFAAGDHLQASEKLWGAAAHALMAAMQERSRSGTTHRALSFSAQRLAREYDDPSIGYGFSLAEKFHRNFCHDFMEEFEMDADRPRVREFVERVLALE